MTPYVIDIAKRSKLFSRIIVTMIQKTNISKIWYRIYFRAKIYQMIMPHQLQLY